MKRSLIACIASCLVLVAAAVLYMFWYESVSAATGQAQNLATQITTRSRAQVRISADSSALAELSNTEAGVSGYFVAPQNVAPFIEDLQSLASTTDASTNVLSVAANTSTSGAGVVAQLPTLTIVLALTGTFDHVVRALGAIEYAPYDLTISSLALSVGNTGVWTANITLTTGSTAASAITSATTTSP